MGIEVTPVKGMMANAYLLTGEKVALVDTLTPSGLRRLKRVMGRKGLRIEDVELVLVTHHHFDHTGNLATIKEASGAVVVAGEGDAPVIDGSEPPPPPGDINRLGRMMGKLPRKLVEGYQDYERVPVDRKVKDGDVIEELDMEVVGLPGHTAGGTGYLDRANRRAFIGDLVSNFFSRLGMPALSASESVGEILSSQEKLSGLGLETAYPGHGNVIEPGASKKIAEFVRKKRELFRKKGLA